MYVIINGVNSDTIQGLQILSLPPITKPKMRTSVATIDGRPGDIVTYLGYEAYNKTIKILLHDTYDLPAIMAYFNQSGTIIFSNDSDKIYTFETIDQINYERAVKFKTASVTIHVQPYKLSTAEEPATGEVSTLVDKTPYIIRRTPFGTRQKGTIVGGSVAWNQLIDVTTKETKTNQGITYTNNGDGSFTLTGTPTSSNTFENINYVAGVNPYILDHVYLMYSGYTGDKKIGVYVYGMTSVRIAVYSTPIIQKADQIGTNGYARFQVTDLQDTDIGTVKLTPQLFDLTLMLGTEIADYIYAQEQATAGAGVALAKAWAGITADYYPYDAGSIKSVTGLTAHKMTGKNLVPPIPGRTASGVTFTSNPDGSLSIVGTATTEVLTAYPTVEMLAEYPLLEPGDYIISGNNGLRLYVMFRDKQNNPAEVTIGGQKVKNYNLRLKAEETFTVTTPCYAFVRGDVLVSDGYVNTTVYPMVRYAGTDGIYEPYTVRTYPLDSSLTLRGLPKLDGDNLYYDGDIYPPSGEVERRYRVVDLGTLKWSKSIQTDSPGRFYSSGLASLVRKPTAAAQYGAFILCSKYIAGRNPISTPKDADKMIAVYMNGNIYISDITYTENTPVEFKEAMSGVYLLYELETPTTEQAEPYTELQICDPAGTEEWVGASMPVGHETTYIDPISMTVTNEGNTESAPSITIEGEGAVEVTVDGLIAFEINMPTTGTITIDSKAMDATDGDGNLANRSVSGDYTNLQLAPGEHTVVVVGDVSNVTMKNVSRWL